MIVYFDDKTKQLAFPINGDRWVLKKPVEPPPTGGGGAGGISIVDTLPTSLTAKDTTGQSWTFNAKQIINAADIIRATVAVPNAASRDVIRIALITALVESVLRIYANTAVYPETAAYPHEADASDSDSVGLFQQRPSAGWGTPKQCMETGYATRAFLGVEANTNRGLFDIAGWQNLSPGTAAQKVQVSAFPDRYDRQVPVANALMDALIKPTSGGGDGAAWQWPFQYSRYVIQSDPLAQFGWRIHPIYHTRKLHMGLDFGAGGIAGLAIPAASAGTVIESGYNGTMGNHVILSHTGNFLTRYFHMVRTPDVSTGQKVTKGQKLGNVGATGAATGAHLHWETWENGAAVNPRDFMKRRGTPES